MYVLCSLQDQGILDQGLCSWHFYKGYNKVNLHWLQRKITNLIYHYSKRKYGLPKYQLLNLMPNHWINEDWPCDDYFNTVFSKHHHMFAGQRYVHPLIEGDANSYRFNLPTISKSLLYVSAESAFLNQHPYITEKTFKPILMKRPFVLLASVGSLAKLREMGFRTFNNYWNEDYDQDADPNIRLHKVLAIVKEICKLSVAELQEMCYSMSDVLEYNFDHYVNHYAGSMFQSRLKELFP
jgi:hypothetical protein